MLRRLLPLFHRVRSLLDTGALLRFLVSLLLAFALWAWVTAESDPEITEALPPVQVTSKGLAEELQVAGDLPQVEIFLQGPRSLIVPIAAEDVQAVVDLTSAKEPGSYTVPVEVAIPDGLRVRSITPNEVTVQVDRSAQKRVPVKTVAPSDIPPNYQLQSISTSPPEVMIKGPAQVIQRVVATQVDVSIDGRSGSFTDERTPVPVDRDGQAVEGLVVQPQQVRVMVNLDVRGQVRKIIPEVVGVDELTPGYELSRSTVLPTDEIIIDGPDDQVSRVSYLTTTPIDVSNWDSSQIVRDVPLDLSQLPQGVTVNKSTVNVLIQIRQERQARNLANVPVQVVNVPPNMTAEVDPTTVTVSLEGAPAIIGALTAEDISVIVDVGSVGPGTHQIEPRVILPAGVQYREVIPQLVSVTIADSSSPPATSSD